MGTNRRTVHQQVLPIGELNKGWLHPLPDTAFTPTVVALIDAVPVAIVRLSGSSTARLR